ncbi:odorant receptor 22c [Diachasma alloeum]|uniref:Odorant receptor n=1 Tax=Diachasma alloeum TaxID=454923 RepID=A0A4E0RT31_9HYME|nr:odorant receptor 22c [Diachasma alloeum]THK33107.1 odorant receptor 37 [Diachasma alloeum]
MKYKEEIHELQWNRDMHYALGFSKLWCRAVGVWPWQRNETSSIVRSGLFFTIQIAAAVSLMERLFVHGNCGSMPNFIEALTGITVFMVTAMKILLPCLQQEQMRHIIQSAMEDWSTVSDARSRQIMSQYAFWGRLAYSIQITAAFIIVLEMTVSRLPKFIIETTENSSLSARNLILGPPCWIPVTMPTSSYLLHYYLIFFSVWGAVLIYPGCDAFMFNAALHICGQFEILNSSIEKITDEDGHLNQRLRIRESLKRHNKLLTLGNQLNDMANLIIFSELLSNGFLICVSGIAVLANIKNGSVNNDDINFGIRIYVWYMELFMYTYVGEKLCDQAEKFQNAVYNCSWYNMSASSAKDIKFIMMRNHSFCYLTAGGIFVMNYEAFKDITRIMFSCFSVLKLVLE